MDFYELIYQLYVSDYLFATLHIGFLAISIIVFNIVPYKEEFEDKLMKKLGEATKKEKDKGRRDTILSIIEESITTQSKNLCLIYDCFRMCAYINIISVIIIFSNLILNIGLLKLIILLTTLLVLWGFALNIHRLKTLYSKRISETIDLIRKKMIEIDKAVDIGRYDILLKEKKKPNEVKKFFVDKIRAFLPIKP